MFNISKGKHDSAENHLVKLYSMVHERENYLSNEAKIVQYNAIIRYFLKFLQQKEKYSATVYMILYQTDIKLGDIYYHEALQNQDNGKYLLAMTYFNQALTYARKSEEQDFVFSRLKEIYYYLDDKDALMKVEMAWAANREKKDQFAAYVLLAQNSEQPRIKAIFLAKALELVMAQDESFYTKYQDTLNVCSQLVVLYEILGENEKARQIMQLRENASKLLN